ncbi:MAG: MBL fold metallo-hydrolase [Acidimicrobiales bacterium]
MAAPQTDPSSSSPSSALLSWRIGDVDVVRVEENILGLPTKVLVPDITAEQIEAQREWVAPYFDPPQDETLMLRLSLHSFVVRSAGKTIVVDTCVGPDPERSLEGDPTFGDRLDATIDGGLAAVDVVVCTHLHFDHVGWNTVTVDGKVVPTFPNARYLVTRPEIEEMERDDHMAVKEPSIQPLADAGVLDVIDIDAGVSGGDVAFRITDEVSLISTPGHTPGHVSVLIESGAASGLITGDAFHSPIQFAYPTLAAWRFDSDSEQSTATRTAMIERFVDSETLVLGTHFAPPTAGRLRRHADQGADAGTAGEADGVWFDSSL